MHKNAPVHQAMIKSIGKSPVKTFTPVMRVPAAPYNGKRQIHNTRPTLPEVVISADDRIATIIGPVQENRKPGLSDERGLNQAVAMRPSTGKSLPLFEGLPIVELKPRQTSLRLPFNESLRMNLTTTQALHGGNCANGCP